MKNMFKKDIFSVIVGLVVLVSFMQLYVLATTLTTAYTSLTKVEAKELPVQTAIPVISNALPQNTVPTKIEIAKIKLDLPVVASPLVDGTWYTYTDVANYAEQTALMNTESGNIGIFAHDKEKGFSKIKQLITGDLIVIYGSGVKGTYKVTKSAIANPQEVDVYYATSEPQLTLVTCDGVFSEKRYIVKAELVSLEKN